MSPSPGVSHASVSYSQTGYPLDYALAKNREKMYDGIHAFVQGVETRLVRVLAQDSAVGLKIPLTVGDVAFLVEELWRGRSVLTNLPTRLVLIRWRKPDSKMLVRIGAGKDEQKSTDLQLRHMVCMTKEEAVKHEKLVFNEGKKLEDVYNKETIERVETQLEEARRYEKFR